MLGRFGTDARPTFNSPIEAVGDVVDRIDSAEGIELTSLGDTFGEGTVGTTSYFLFNDQPGVIRVLTTITNPTANAVTTAAWLAVNPDNNFGGPVNPIATSSGDNIIDDTDRFFGYGDGNPQFFRPGLVHVLAGEDAEVGVDRNVTDVRYSGSDRNGIETKLDDVTFAAGETASFLFFLLIDADTTDGLPTTDPFVDLESLDEAELLAGLSDAELGQIRNWRPIPAPGAGVVGFVALAAATRRRRG